MYLIDHGRAGEPGGIAPPTWSPANLSIPHRCCRVAMSVVSQTKLSDETCSSAHIAKISEHIECWEELSPYFGLTSAEEKEIKFSHAHQYKVQKRKMLWKWVNKQGDKATYGEPEIIHTTYPG